MIQSFKINEEDIRAAYKQGEDAIVDLFIQMKAMMEAMEARIQVLEDRLAKNSSNSGKPPSSDGYQKPAPKSLRKRHGRKSGGQTGHQGNTLRAVEKPDEIKVHSIHVCKECERSLEEVEIRHHEKRQVFDLPPLTIMVTEYRAEVKICPNCGMRNKADFPAGVDQPVQYGPKIKAQMVYFNQYQLLPLERLVETMQDLYGIGPSEATVIAACQEAAQKIKPGLEDIKEHLIRKEPVVQFDETGVRVDGKLHWLHSVSTEELTYYVIHAKRGQKAMDEINVLPNMRGRAIHDGWPSYFKYDVRHGLCNAHHLRRLIFLEERYPQTWATEMIKLLVEIKEAVEKARENQQTCLTKMRLSDFENRYDLLVETGLKSNPFPKPVKGEPKKRGRPKQTPAQNLLNAFKTHKAFVLAFMYDFRVPFDNNLAERDLRMMKVKLKISGCFRTLQGADTFCLIRGFISTTRKNGMCVLETLRQVFDGKSYLPELLFPG